MEPLKVELELFPYLRRNVELCCFLLTRQVYSQKGLLCRSSHEVLIKMAARLLKVRRRLPISFTKTKRLLLSEYTGVVNNPSSTKLSYSKLENAVLNPSKSFLALKKSALGFCRLLKDRSLKK